MIAHWTCKFCGETDRENFQMDGERGFWCEWCDGYTYLNEEERHNFTLILEKEIHRNTFEKSKNHNYKRFQKRLSPLRYPGGKSKMIDALYKYMRESKTKKMISAYSGGCSFELAMLAAGVIQELHINDLDKGIYSFWLTVKNNPGYLIKKIVGAVPTHQDYFEAKTIIKSGYEGVSLEEAAWCVLLVNRLSYSGILNANPLGGKAGGTEQLLSRWNPNELVKRINRIHGMSEKIEVTNMDAIELIEEMYWDEKTTIFIDPPFVAKGHLLYNCYYKEEDHRRLAELLDNLYSGFPGADIVVTYDWHDLIGQIYSHPEECVINRIYSA